jgi:hypothetical protein
LQAKAQGEANETKKFFYYPQTKIKMVQRIAMQSAKLLKRKNAKNAKPCV